MNAQVLYMWLFMKCYIKQFTSIYVIKQFSIMCLIYWKEKSHILYPISKLSRHNETNLQSWYFSTQLN